MPTLRSIDPFNCGCTDCLSGDAVPAKHATPADIVRCLTGELANCADDCHISLYPGTLIVYIDGATAVFNQGTPEYEALVPRLLHLPMNSAAYGYDYTLTLETEDWRDQVDAPTLEPAIPSRDLLAIDPAGCECSDCATGSTVDLEHATDTAIYELLAGRTENNTGMVPIVTFDGDSVHVGFTDYEGTWASSSFTPLIPYLARLPITSSNGSCGNYELHLTCSRWRGCIEI